MLEWTELVQNLRNCSYAELGSLESVSVESKTLLRKLGLKIVPFAADGLLRFDDVELGEDVLVADFPFGEIFDDTVKVA